MKTLITVLLSAASLTILFGSPNPQLVMDCPADEDGSVKSDTLRFKGFYLGMPLGCAVKLIKEKYSPVFGEIKVNNVNAQIASGLDANERENLEAASAILNIDPSSLLTGSLRKSQQKRAVYALYALKALSYTPIIDADADKRIIAFHLPSILVDALFNSEDMKPEDFAQQFATSYNIPSMEYFMREHPLVAGHYEQGWEYTSPNGFYVEIDEDKGLVLEFVPTSAERKFD